MEDMRGSQAVDGRDSGSSCLINKSTNAAASFLFSGGAGHYWDTMGNRYSSEKHLKIQGHQLPVTLH
eukprot:scaffold165432_cov31-Tisochrysis_lutea.AAC.5